LSINLQKGFSYWRMKSPRADPRLSGLCSWTALGTSISENPCKCVPRIASFPFRTCGC